MPRPLPHNAARQPRRTIAVSLGLLTALVTSQALAQQAAPTKSPPPVVQPAPAASAPSGTGAAAASTPSTRATGPASSKPSASTTPTGELPNLPMEAEVDNTDTREEPNRKYYFIGL